MASLKERVTSRVDRLRERRPSVDHAVKTFQHYGAVNGNGQAGAATYFGFLSFFPILALAFFVVGWVAKVYPDAQRDLVVTINQLLPGIVGKGRNQISIETFEKYAGTIGLIGLFGVLYSGLGWLSGMRDALESVFQLPPRVQPNLVLGKIRDLLTLVVIGTTLLVSVAVSGMVSGFSELLLGWVGLGDSVVAAVLLPLLGLVLGVAATTVLFFAMYRLLAQPGLPRKAVLEGAVLGAVGFEVLKYLASFLMAGTKNEPAAQAFGVALILLVWINYFSRVTMYGAAYAYAAPEAERRRAEAAALAEIPVVPVSAAAVPVGGDKDSRGRAVLAGVMAGAALGAVAARKRTAED